MNTPDDGPRIDEALVGQLLARQFPAWAHLPLQRVNSAGTDNAIFRLGDGLAVRLPMRMSAASQPERELRWLPGLAAQLPLTIPAPIAGGKPDAAYPWAWSVHPWLPGEDAASARVHDLSIAARDLGGFLHALGRIDAAGGPAAGSANSGRGVPLALLDKRVRNDVASLGDEIDETAVLAAWDQALAAPLHVGAGAWVHGDLHPGNLLIRDGRIVVLGEKLGPAHKVFREVVEADEAAWLRGRGWAIFSAIIALAFYLRTNPTLCAISRRTLTEVLG